MPSQSVTVDSKTHSATSTRRDVTDQPLQATKETPSDTREQSPSSLSAIGCPSGKITADREEHGTLLRHDRDGLGRREAAARQDLLVGMTERAVAVGVDHRVAGGVAEGEEQDEVKGLTQGAGGAQGVDDHHHQEGRPGHEEEAADDDHHGAGLAQLPRGSVVAAAVVGASLGLGRWPPHLLTKEAAQAHLHQHPQVEGRDGGEGHDYAQHHGGQEEGAAEVAVVAAAAGVRRHRQAGEARAGRTGEPHGGDDPAHQLWLGEQEAAVQERVADGSVALGRHRQHVELRGHADEEAGEQHDVAQPRLHEDVALHQPQDEEGNGENPDLPRNQSGIVLISLLRTS